MQVWNWKDATFSEPADKQMSSELAFILIAPYEQQPVHKCTQSAPQGHGDKYVITYELGGRPYVSNQSNY